MAKNSFEDWVNRLDAFLQFNEEDILHDKGKVTAAIAKAFAESEFEKFRVLQDRTYQSDFDRLAPCLSFGIVQIHCHDLIQIYHFFFVQVVFGD